MRNVSEHHEGGVFMSDDDIAISQGPVSFGQSGQISVFVRDPDRIEIELRGREQGPVEGVTRYVP